MAPTWAVPGLLNFALTCSALRVYLEVFTGIQFINVGIFANCNNLRISATFIIFTCECDDFSFSNIQIELVDVKVFCIVWREHLPIE